MRVQGIGDHTQLTQQTPHFRIHYLAGSFADQHLALVSERLEQAHRILADVLGVNEADVGIIDVYLSEMLAGPQLTGNGGTALPSPRDIHGAFLSILPAPALSPP